jgi:hypothetical protein
MFGIDDPKSLALKVVFCVVVALLVLVVISVGLSVLFSIGSWIFGEKIASTIGDVASQVVPPAVIPPTALQANLMGTKLYQMAKTIG